MTDSQWEIIKPILQEAKYRSLEEKQEQINAVFYLVKTGCQWRDLPKDFDSIRTGSRKNHIDETGKNIYTIKNTDGVQQWKAKRQYHSYPIESITIFP